MAFCDQCGKEMREGAKFCDSCGADTCSDHPTTSFPPKGTGPVASTKPERGKRKLKPIFIYITLVVIIIFIVLSVAVPNILRERARSSFESCRDQLNTISSGMQDQIVTKGSLEGVNSVDDICHHIVSGFDSPEECAGMVKERVNAVCKEDTLTVDVLDEISYEIKAQPRVKSSRNICITEKSSFIREIAENAGIDFFEVDGKFLCEFGFDGCICVHGVDDFTSE